MAVTDNLSITQVEASQSQKEVTLNEAIGALADAGNALYTVTVVDGSDPVITNVENLTDSAENFVFDRHVIFDLVDDVTTPPTAAFTLELPSANRFFVIRNSSAQQATVEVDPGSDGADGSTIDIAAGDSIIAYSDGTNLTNLGSGSGGGGGGGPSAFLSLTDTPSSFSGQAGQVLKVNAGEDALEFADDNEGTGGGSGGSGGGGMFGPLSPPSTTDFAEVLVGSATGSAFNSSTRGMIIETTGTGNDTWVMRMKPVSEPVTGTDVYIARLMSTLSTEGFPGAGFILRNSTNGRFLLFGNDGNLSNVPDIAVQEWTNTTFGQALVSHAAAQLDFWAKVEIDAGGAVRFFFSMNAATWTLVFSTTFANHIEETGGGTFDQIGFGVKYTTLSIGNISLGVPFYSEDGSIGDAT